MRLIRETADSSDLRQVCSFINPLRAEASKILSKIAQTLTEVL